VLPNSSFLCQSALGVSLIPMQPNMGPSRSRHTRCAAARRHRQMLRGVIVHVAPIGHAFVKVVSLGLHRSFCETCCRITGHPRRIRFGGQSSALSGDLCGNS
jgi:hypothetical protein